MEKAQLEMSSSEIGEGFLYAMANQYAFDEMYFSLFGESIDDFRGMPRPSKWVVKTRSFTWVAKQSSRILRWFWLYVASYLFFFVKLMRYFWEKKKYAVKPKNTSGVDLALAICSRSVDVIKIATAGLGEKIWLGLPGNLAPKCAGLSNEKLYNCLSILSRRQLFSAFLMSCALHNLARENENKNLAMQTYVAFDWVILLMAINQLKPKRIITAEHHDRWAVLADCYCSCMSVSGTRVDLTLVQHGKEHDRTYQELLKKGKYESLPYRLKCVTEAYLYDESQHKVFNENIFSRDENSSDSTKVYFYKYFLDVYDTGLSGLVILIVGHPLCEALQIELYKRVRNKERYSFFYKPHPSAKGSKPAELDWILVDDSSRFPKSSFLISYPSTLVDEYFQIGVESFVHPLGEGEADIDAMAEELNKKLDLLI